jgi:tRNA nucleotidyltransferase (CCA-adding enzyme)
MPWRKNIMRRYTDPKLVNEIVKNFVGEGWVEAYTEHPYVKAKINNYEIEFIPCFRSDPPTACFQPQTDLLYTQTTS